MVTEKGVHVLVVEDAPLDAGQIASFLQKKACPHGMAVSAPAQLAKALMAGTRRAARPHPRARGLKKA